MPFSDITLRPMRQDDRDAVSRLIFDSTNYYYTARLGAGPIFTAGPESTRLFCDTYEALDPGCCVIAQEPTGRVIGSCFYHLRDTHVSVGIMNIHPEVFGRGVARQMLDFITDFADRVGKPVRLVSSAMNLDSFSLYTRSGFVPRAAYQDMLIAVPESGFSPSPAGRERVRDARMEDAAFMVDLEMEISHIARRKDFDYFVRNEQGIWHVSVLEDASGALEGFLVSVKHAASTMLGPGAARTEGAALALIAAELDHHRGGRPVLLVPVDCHHMVSTLYQWGARNCEIHFAQVRGTFHGFHGISMPTFMPETG